VNARKTCTERLEALAQVLEQPHAVDGIEAGHIDTLCCYTKRLLERMQDALTGGRAS